MIELAVCGAHMSELPLNWQLRECGARFICTAQTSPQYQFYALAGGPPARPGLVRSNALGAASVSLEIWSMPKTMLGTFIEAIELSDGTWVKGFLCEASGVEGATNVSHIGDWRKVLAS
jgi:allophanate hydrolase